MDRDIDLILDGKVPPLKKDRRPSSKPQDVVEVADRYYVLVSSVANDQAARVLKQGETFAVLDAYGDVRPVTHPEAGVFHQGTRHLSRFEFTLCGEERPLLLNSTLRDDNGLLKVDMTNRDLQQEGAPFLPKGSLYIHREKLLTDSRCLEALAITNYASRAIEIQIRVWLAVDFVDLFEIRGLPRAARGVAEPPVREGDQIRFGYQGLDGVHRATVLQVRGVNFEFSDEQLFINATLAAKSKLEVEFEFQFLESQKRPAPPLSYAEALQKVSAAHAEGRNRYCGINSSNEQFDQWLRRSTDDLVMMTTPTSVDGGAPYPYAGIPWFCAPFGRDGVLTAMECLWANPDLARGVLEFLAATQSAESDPERDAAPGKIIHEARFGEMANLGEIPFGRYYGSVDATPLFVALAGQYYVRTGDLDFVRTLWPHIMRAITWMNDFGDIDGDGWIEYRRESKKGLVQQGWKDSTDSIFHQDGSEARGPIALAEVQAYAYMARIEASRLASALSHGDLSQTLSARASELRQKFDREFWLDDLGTFAMALDGEKQPCRIPSSNAGQCLFTGIALPERADRLARTLLSPENFSGWGVRTVSTEAARFNPMSYHNGSVWPHDVALIAWGLSKYGQKEAVDRIFTGLFSAATYMELMRMPEVFCGFPRRRGEAPTLYPHACAPQAWAAGSVYLLLQSLLGLEIDALEKRVSLNLPRLPDSIETLRLTGIRVGDACVDLIVQNYIHDVSVQIARRTHPVTVVVEK